MHYLISELSETDNAKINDFVVNSKEDDIAMAIDFICTSCLPNNDPTFPAFYNKQLDRLKDKRVLKEDIDHLKQLIDYEYKKTDYDRLDRLANLQPALSKDYESKKHSVYSPIKSIEEYYGSEEYSQIVGNDHFTLGEFKLMLRDASNKTALKMPTEPKKAEFNLSKIELIKSLNFSQLQTLLLLLIQNIDSSDLELVKASMILIIAHHCVTDSSHHKKNERSSTTGELSGLKLKQQYDELYNTYLELKQN